MRPYLCFVSLTCLIVLFPLMARAQDRPDEAKELSRNLSFIIMDQCHLTCPVGNIYVSLLRDTMTMNLSFNNESLKTFWSPEVAVQYIFDAALWPVLRKVWAEGENRRYVKVRFRVRIPAHPYPPELVFAVTRKDWDDYIAGGEKIILFECMEVTSKGNPYVFDAGEAVAIE